MLIFTKGHSELVKYTVMVVCAHIIRLLCNIARKLTFWGLGILYLFTSPISIRIILSIFPCWLVRIQRRFVSSFFFTYDMLTTPQSIQDSYSQLLHIRLFLKLLVICSLVIYNKARV